MMTSRSKISAGIFSLLLSGCANQNVPLIKPAYPFKIRDYPVFIDSKPGAYYVIGINEKKYCYFWKQTEKEKSELFIDDLACDLKSDRVLVLSGNKISAVSDAKNLEKEVLGMLNYLLYHSEKIVVKSNGLIIF